MHKISLLEYIYKILTINLIGFGGAPLTVGYYQSFFVDTKAITVEELNQYVALGNVLPGAMSFYVSGLIGYRLFNKKGLIIGVSLCVIPILLITILFYKIILLTGIDFHFLIFLVLPLIIINTFKYLKNLISLNISIVTKTVIFLIALFMLMVLKVSSTNLMVLFVAITFIYSIASRRQNDTI